ncbi:P-loop containing nucleoside triphosphate hydrolase protein [Earliella scabrosa]|nr:P-loop containing nucleoside triphosphate hydrolase protein [Earliella scabrosa]
MASYLSQNVLPSHCAPQRISLHRLTTRTCSVVAKHILENDVEALGVSLRVAQDGALSAVVFATSTNVFFVDLAGTGGAKSGRLNDLQGLLCHSSCVLAGFGMARIALHLYRHCGLSVKGVDLSTLYASSTRTPQSPAEFVSTRIYEGVSRHQIHKLWYRDEADNLYLRAWLSAVCAEDSTAVMEYCAKVDTRNLTASELQCLTGLILNVELLDAGKPTKMENEFDDIEVGPDGQLLVRNARYNTRLRPSKQTSIVLETSHGRSVVGQAIRANGKQTDVVVVGGSVRGAIERICVIGREEFTNSEFARDEFILLLLHGAVPPLIESPFIRMLWFPTLHPTQRSYRPAAPSVFHNSYASLNTSQKEVVRAMWSDEEPLVVAHGPPGTGKTTTIAAALEQWDYRRAPAWVIAQSNVGVKNIARTLIKYNVDFRLIVSKEFYVEWHEHLYESIEERLIRSDDLFSDPVYTERKLSGATTILCTVAMLSNPALDSSAVFRFVPVERLIVDEASQIDSFEFLHLFHTFKRLEKVCMFGDPKQLPPYGKETAPLMKTIFDFKQLKPLAYFLNTQYRMPVPLGDFISDQVYNSKLKSVHNITDGSCVRFVDVRKGAEESVGSSWKVRGSGLLAHFDLHSTYSCDCTPEYGGSARYRESRATLLQASQLMRHHAVRRSACRNHSTAQGRGLAVGVRLQRRQLPRTRGSIRHRLDRAHYEARLPPLPQSHERHAHPVQSRHDSRHQPSLPRRPRAGHTPRRARTTMASLRGRVG